MSAKDFYDVLGIERGAGKGEIKKAYRRLAMEYHPDRNAGDKSAEEKFKEVQRAYDVLGDDKKRQAYDQYGHAGVDPNMGGAGAQGFEDIFGGGGFPDIGSIFEGFEGIFGGGRGGGQRASRGADLRYHLELDLEQAVQGHTVKIQVPTWVACKPCSGSGAAKGSTPSRCEDCGGAGQVRMQKGFFSVQQTCPSCRGTGQVILNPCDACHGQGRTQDTKVLSIKVPAGVDSGDRIRLSDEGEAGSHGAPAGDLYVQVSVRPHDIFTRQESDLYCEVPVNMVTAALGGEIEVPTLKGRVKLKVPAETQGGKLFRLRGKGVKPVRGGGVGDLLCRVVVETPVNLSDKQRKQLKEFGQSMEKDDRDHSPGANAWLKRVKRFFDDMRL